MLIESTSAQYIKVIDGDSFFINNREIRLSGIDAPEYRQKCYDSQNKSYACGKQSAKALKSMLRKGNLSC